MTAQRGSALGAAKRLQMPPLDLHLRLRVVRAIVVTTTDRIMRRLDVGLEHFRRAGRLVVLLGLVHGALVSLA